MSCWQWRRLQAQPPPSRSLEALMKKYLRQRLDACADNPWCGVLSAYLLVCIVVVLTFLGIRYAHAHDHNKPDLNSFYSGLKDNNGNSCCNLIDCHETEAAIRGDHWWAQLAVQENGQWQPRPEWMEIPDDKVIKNSNPTGKAIFCHTVSWKNKVLDPKSITIRCFLPPEQVYNAKHPNTYVDAD